MSKVNWFGAAPVEENGTPLAVTKRDMSTVRLPRFGAVNRPSTPYCRLAEVDCAGAVVTATGAFAVIAFFSDRMKALVDLATTVSFLVAPVIAVVNFPPRQIGPVISEVLTLGMPDENGAVVLVKPDLKVPDGGKLF